MNFLKEVRTRWKGYKEKHFLATHGCSSWREYRRKYDPDYSGYAGKINSMYHGYPHVIRIDDHTHYAYRTFDRKIQGYIEIEDWCYQICEDKFRVDWQRVIQNYWGEWEENGIGGGDYLFFAFKSSKDAMMFNLRWL